MWLRKFNDVYFYRKVYGTNIDGILKANGMEKDVILITLSGKLSFHGWKAVTFVVKSY